MAIDEKLIMSWLDEDKENLEKIRKVLHENSPNKANPVDYVRWVPLEKVTANDYNPNAVAKVELQLLYLSIDADGYTQPVVTYYDKERDVYEIVDGYHRYYVMKSNKELIERNHGLLPVVVIDKSINERRASTVRHNRARGEHSFDGMANLVIDMTRDGWSDEEICKQLGMEPEEVVRLKIVSGYASLYKDGEFGNSWVAGRIGDELVDVEDSGTEYLTE